MCQNYVQINLFLRNYPGLGHISKPCTSLNAIQRELVTLTHYVIPEAFRIIKQQIKSHEMLS
jgi:hypothetical protein